MHCKREGIKKMQDEKMSECKGAPTENVEREKAEEEGD